jgi:uncharacterized protein (TIGR02453 family)
MTGNKNHFNGFNKDTIKFMVDLGMNNYKTWFVEHRDEYEKHLLIPMQNLVKDLSKYMLDIDPAFEVTPKTDKTISRIYKDIRFSKDKTPYRNNMWITFKRKTGNWKEKPVYFFELLTTGYRFGLGYYQATTATMKLFRKTVDRDYEEFLKAVKPIGNYFSVQGINYKRPLPGIRDKKIDEYYNKKSFYLSYDSQLDDMLFSKNLPASIARGFKKTVGLYKYLTAL